MFGLHYGPYSPVVKLNASLRAARWRSVTGSRAVSGSQPASCLSASLYKEHWRGADACPEQNSDFYLIFFFLQEDSLTLVRPGKISCIAAGNLTFQF